MRTRGRSLSSGGRVDALSVDELVEAFAAFLAADPKSLSSFLNETGLDPFDLRAALNEATSRGAILDHIMADEPLLMTFAQYAAIEPDIVAATITRVRAPHLGEAI